MISETLLNPLSEEVICSADELQRFYTSENPLKNFLNLQNFLSPQTTNALLNSLKNIKWQQHAVWSENESMTLLHSFSGKQEFCKENYYLTIHQRPTVYPKVFKSIERLMGEKEVIETLQRLTGTKISKIGTTNVLTSWNAGDFLGPHCDSGGDNPSCLIISISLTENWKSEYGGKTDFNWSGQNKIITTLPNFNQATLFTPGKHSLHWVNQISSKVPNYKRVTWTLHYY